MAYLVEMPVENGGRLLLQATGDVPAGLELASSPANGMIAKAGQSLGQAFDQIAPAIQLIHSRIAAMAPAEAVVEFGLVLGAETGIVVAKGTSEVHFAVRLSWKHHHDDG